MPRKLPAIVLPPLSWIVIGFRKPLITNPRIVVPPSFDVKAGARELRGGAVSSMRRTALMPAVTGLVFALEPGWLKPSMTRGSVISNGKPVRRIVCTPGPGMLKSMVSIPESPAGARRRRRWCWQP